MTVTRLTKIIAGYLVGCVASGMTIVLASFLPHYVESALSPELVLIGWVWATATAATLIYSALPTLLVVVYAEHAKIRSVGYYVSGGALIGIVAVTLFLVLMLWLGGSMWGFISGRTPTVMSFMFGSCVLAGIVAGLVYWLMAGRHAGTAPRPR